MMWSAPIARSSVILPVLHTDDLGSGCLGDLHGEAAHSSGGADDQHLVTRLDAPPVAYSLECGEGGDRHGGGLFERDVGRRGGGADARVLRERAVGDAEHGIARREARDVAAHGLARLAQLWPNLRAAVAWACTSRDVELADALVRPIVVEVDLRRQAEIGDWAEQILDLASPTDESRVVFWLLWAGHATHRPATVTRSRLSRGTTAMPTIASCASTRHTSPRSGRTLTRCPWQPSRGFVRTARTMRLI